MKKNFMTRVLAVAMSAAMALSMATATNLTVAEAASAPAMKNASFTVRVGNAAKTYRATAATRKAYKIVKAAAGNADKATAKIVKSGKAVAITAGTKTGKTVITLTFKNRKTAAKKTVKFEGKVLAPKVEELKIASIAQKTFTEFEVTMSKALEKVTAADFAMVRDNDNQVITVKSATLDTTDAKKVKLVVYTSLTDAKTYTVTYTDADKKTASGKVTVTDGVVADVAITPLEITANVQTLIEYQTIDANGVVISQKAATKAASDVDVTWDSLLGTMNNDTSKYILYNEGDTAKFTVTYHTYKYDATTGAEIGVISKEFTVTAVKNATVITQYAYTATTLKPYDWSSVTPKTTIALDDDGTTSAVRTAWFLIKDSKGNDVTSTCGYTVESANNSVVVADGTVADGAVLSPVSVGSTYLIIKDADGKAVTNMPITVGSKRTVTTLKLTAPVVTIASTAAFIAPETVGWTDVVTLDQYGEFINTSLEVTNKTNNGVCDIHQVGTSYKVEGNNLEGYDNYLVTATDALGKYMTTTLKVVTKKVSGAVSYSVVFLNAADKIVTTIDTTINEDPTLHGLLDTGDKKIKAVIVKKQSSVVTGKLANADGFRISSVSVTKNDGTIIAKAVSGSATITSSTAIAASVMTAGAATKVLNDVDTNNGNLVASAAVTAGAGTTETWTKNLGVGTYTVAYEIMDAAGTVKKANASYTVTDAQTKVTAKVLNTACGSATTLDSALAAEDNVVYFYGDVYLGAISPNAKKVTYSTSVSGGYKSAYVTYTVVTVPVAGQDYKMNVVVPINKAFTTTASWS